MEERDRVIGNYVVMGGDSCGIRKSILLIPFFLRLLEKRDFVLAVTRDSMLKYIIFANNPL